LRSAEIKERVIVKQFSMKPWSHILLLFCLWVSCNEPLNDLPPCNENNPCAEDACQPENCVEDSTFVGLDTLWSLNLKGSIRNAVLDGDNLYFNLRTDEGFNIVKVSHSGELLWEYTNDLPYTAIMHNASNLNALIGQYFDHVFSIDGESGNELVNSSIGLGIPSTTYGYLIDNYYYSCVHKNDESEAYLVRSDVEDLENWEVIFTVKRSDVGGSRPNVESVNRWAHPDTQDEILVLQHRMAFPNRVDLVAYNLSADSILWWHPEIDENGDSNIRQITISHGRAYFQGTSKLRCFDIATGDLIWETNYGPWNQGGKFFGLGDIVFTASEDILVVKYHEGLLALNAATGAEIWDKNDDDIHNTSSFTMTMYNDIVFFTHVGNGLTYNGPLWAIRASDGEEIWMKSTDFATTGSFSGPVLIDEERKVFYTRHEGNLIAFRMPEDMY